MPKQTIEKKICLSFHDRGNKLTLKVLFYVVYMWRTLPPFQLQTLF